MGRRGPRAEPNAMKILRGADPRTIHTNVVTPVSIAPDCPKWLPADAKALWADIGPELVRLNLLTAIDGPAFSLLVSHFAVSVKAIRALKQGLMVNDPDHKGDDGEATKRKSPASQVFRDHSTAFLRYMNEFGLSPASRARLSTPDPKSGKETEDDFDGFIGRGRNKKKA